MRKVLFLVFAHEYVATPFGVVSEVIYSVMNEISHQNTRLHLRQTKAMRQGLAIDVTVLRVYEKNHLQSL